ncbi:MAG: hypothetical protein KDH90_19285, partial [Anaerolineae bacterium]|nr:hypothetical protein [Anaerolineae bacterium]
VEVADVGAFQAREDVDGRGSALAGGDDGLAAAGARGAADSMQMVNPGAKVPIYRHTRAALKEGDNTVDADFDSASKGPIIVLSIVRYTAR